MERMSAESCFSVKQRAHQLSLFADHTSQEQRQERINRCSLVALLPVKKVRHPVSGLHNLDDSLHQWQPGSESAVESILDSLRKDLLCSTDDDSDGHDLALKAHLRIFYVVPSLVRLLIFLHHKSVHKKEEEESIDLSNGFKLAILNSLIDLIGDTNYNDNENKDDEKKKKKKNDNNDDDGTTEYVSGISMVTKPVTSMLCEHAWDCIKYWSMDKAERKVMAGLVKWIDKHCVNIQSIESSMEMIGVCAQCLGSRVSKEIIAAMDAIRNILISRNQNKCQEECMHFICGFQDSSVVNLDWWFGPGTTTTTTTTMIDGGREGGRGERVSNQLKQNYLSALCDHPKRKVRRSLYSMVMSLCCEMSTSYDYRTLLLTYVMSGLIENDCETRCKCLKSVEMVSEHWMADTDLCDLTNEKHSTRVWIDIGIIDPQDMSHNIKDYVPSLECLSLMREHFGRIHMALLSEIKSSLIKPKQKFMTLNLLLVFIAYLQWYIGGFSLQISEALRQAKLSLNSSGSSSLSVKSAKDMSHRNEIEEIIEVCLQTLHFVCQFDGLHSFPDDSHSVAPRLKIQV